MFFRAVCLCWGHKNVCCEKVFKKKARHISGFCIMLRILMLGCINVCVCVFVYYTENEKPKNINFKL